jgi:autotransporter-associated beta strand protein
MNASRSSPLVARPAARAAAVAAAVLLAAGSAAGQTSPITNNTTINSSVSFASGLIVGSSPSPGPTLTINSGANISIGGIVEPFYVGTNSNPFATVIQNGGSVTVDGTTSSGMVLGQNSSPNTQYTGSASYTLNSGSLTLGAIGDTTAGGYLSIGRSSNAAFTQTGGTITAYRTGAVLVMGLVNSGTGSYEISGGTFEGIGATDVSNAGLRIAERLNLSGGQGTLTISGGTVAIEQGNTWLTREGSSTATVNLTAGTLALNGNVTRGVPNSGNAPGTVAFTLGGGTLRPYDENLVVGPTTAANTAAFNITLASSTTSTITGVGWKTGSIHAVTMDTPLIGTGNIDFAGGTVTLAAANTYSGTTTISGGTLALGASGSIASSSLIDIRSGAFFNVASVSGGFSLASTQTLGGRGTLTGAATFADGSKLAFDATGPLIAANTLSFANFGIGSLADVNWDSLDLNSPYTLIDGDQNFTSAGLLNFGESSKTPVGTNRQAYFQAPGDGTSLQLVVVPEPAVLPLGGLAIAAAAWALRRRAAVR